MLADVIHHKPARCSRCNRMVEGKNSDVLNDKGLCPLCISSDLMRTVKGAIITEASELFMRFEKDGIFFEMQVWSVDGTPYLDVAQVDV